MGYFFRFLVSKVFVINLLVALLLVSGGLFATLSCLDSYTLHGEEVEVPGLVDLHITVIDVAIQNKDQLLVEISDSVFVKGKAGGSIIEQNPEAGKMVKQGRVIYLTLAADKPASIKMPKLVDKSLRQATSILETYGLEVGEMTYRPDMCSNCILEQKVSGQDIQAGDRIQIGSIIDLVVGQGLSNELVMVPYLLEFNTEMAKDLLQSKSLNLGVQLYDETVETAEDSANAIVYRQLPPFSQEPDVRMGAPIDLFLTLDKNKVIHSVIPELDSIP